MSVKNDTFILKCKFLMLLCANIVLQHATQKSHLPLYKTIYKWKHLFQISVTLCLEYWNTNAGRDRSVIIPGENSCTIPAVMQTFTILDTFESDTSYTVQLHVYENGFLGSANGILSLSGSYSHTGISISKFPNLAFDTRFCKIHYYLIFLDHQTSYNISTKYRSSILPYKS